MIKFASKMSEIKRRCSEAGKMFLFFDFDGTLAPIVNHPSKAKMSAAWKKRLERLVSDGRFSVCVISGRSIADMQRMIDVPGVILGANHGYEVWHGGKCVLRKAGRFIQFIDALGRAMAEELGGVKGVYIEHKGYSVSFHYRMIAKSKKAAVKRRVIEIAEPYCRAYGFEIMEGKEMVEVRPRGFWDKGKACLRILGVYSRDALPLYFGDDTTDEDAFRALKGKGITVRIGKDSNSTAEYYVDDMNAAAGFVDWLIGK